MDTPEALDLNHHDGTLANLPLKNDKNTKNKGHRHSKHHHRHSKNRHSKSSKTKVGPDSKEETDEGLASKPKQQHLSEHHSMEREESAPDSGPEESNVYPTQDEPTQDEEELTFDVETPLGNFVNSHLRLPNIGDDLKSFWASAKDSWHIVKVLAETETQEARAVEISEAISVPMGQVSAQATRPETSGEAVASLVCGIISIFFFGLILGPMAICLGCAALDDIRSNPDKVQGRCQAIAGVRCGCVAILLWSLLLLSVIARALATTFT